MTPETLLFVLVAVAIALMVGILVLLRRLFRANVSIITARSHGLSVGDVVHMDGARHRVTATTRDSFSARRMGLLESLWFVLLSSFWSLVWNRP